jgi:hypothetical protein
METGNRQEISPSQENFEIGMFRPEDAQGIVDLFRSVYGEDYPVKVFYDPVSLTRANETGEYLSVVVRTQSGTVVAAQHLFRSAPFSALYEAGAGLVKKEFRQLHLNTKTLHFLYEGWIPENPNIEEIFGEPVCNHTHQQRVVGSLAHVEMALEVALMPAAAYDKEKSASGRVAALLAFRTYKPKPHTIFLPPEYESQLRWLYKAPDYTRTLALADKELPKSDACSADLTVFDFAQVARIAIHRVGSDFEGYLDSLENDLNQRGVVVIQIWLNLAWPWIGAAVEVLKRRGYFLGGALPRWFDDDGLLMQKVLVEPGFEQIQIYSDRGRKILEMVREDWRKLKA